MGSSNRGPQSLHASTVVDQEQAVPTAPVPRSAQRQAVATLRPAADVAFFWFIMAGVLGGSAIRVRYTNQTNSSDQVPKKPESS